MATIKDTTILNTLFQKEFRTSIQLSDIMEFLLNREVEGVGFPEEEDLRQWAIDNGFFEWESIGHAEFVEELESRVERDEDSVRCAIANSSVGVSQLFPDEEIVAAYALIYPKDQAQQRHAEEEGVNCPSCGSTDMETAQAIGLENDWVYVPCACNACGATWDNRYDLSGFSELTLKGDSNG